MGTWHCRAGGRASESRRLFPTFGIPPAPFHSWTLLIKNHTKKPNPKTTQSERCFCRPGASPGRCPGIFISAAPAVPAIAADPARLLHPAIPNPRLPKLSPGWDRPGHPEHPRGYFGDNSGVFLARFWSQELPAADGLGYTRTERFVEGAWGNTGILLVFFPDLATFGSSAGAAPGPAERSPRPRERGVVWIGHAPPQGECCVSIGCAGDDVGALRRFLAAPVASI